MRVLRELSLYLFPVSIEWFIEYQGFLAVVRLGSTPTPIPPLPSASSLSFSDFLCVAGRANWRERCGAGGRRGAKSYNREEAWPSINHSILSAYFPIQIKPCIRSMQQGLLISKKALHQYRAGSWASISFFIPKIDDCIDLNWNARCCSDDSRKPPYPSL